MNQLTRILLVEPEDVLAEVTAFRLELLGYIVRRVASGEEALEELESHRPDVILTNLDLPSMDGVTLIEKIASDQETNNIPVMVLSVEADLDRVQAVHRAGGRDFLVVPFEPEHLEEKVARLAELSRESSQQAVAK